MSNGAVFSDKDLAIIDAFGEYLADIFGVKVSYCVADSRNGKSTCYYYEIDGRVSFIHFHAAGFMETIGLLLSFIGKFTTQDGVESLIMLCAYLEEYTGDNLVVYYLKSEMRTAVLDLCGDDVLEAIANLINNANCSDDKLASNVIKLH